MAFKVGDKIRRTTDPVQSAPIGFETVVVEPEFDAGVGRVWFRNRYGDTVYGNESNFELISESPVRTVTRQEIIPGTYDGVSVMGQNRRLCRVAIIPSLLDADELDRAAAVLTALAGALRDAS